MSQYKNVTVTKKANVYFDGKVTSRSIAFEDGTTKTLGIMLPGEYEFNTGKKELMEIYSGDLDVMLPNIEGWTHFSDGTNFIVPAHSSFKLSVKVLTDYCCSFLDD